METKGLRTMLRFIQLFILLWSLTMMGQAGAQQFPQRPVTIIVPFTPGSGTDLVGRLIADELAKRLGGTFLVDNKPGAGGAIGVTAVARAKPDGYTLLITSSATHSAAPWLTSKMGYDPKTDFAHISVLAEANYLLLVPVNSSVHSLAEVARFAAAKGGRLTYGYGSQTSQILSAAFMDLLGVPADGVPYKSQPQVLTDLAGERLDIAVADVSASQALLDAKRLRPLVISTPSRMSAVPSVPTLAESGYKPLGISGWIGLAAPAGTPPGIIRQVNQALREALASEALASRFVAMGLKPAYTTNDAVNAFIESQLEAWGTYAKKAGLKPE